MDVSCSNYIYIIELHANHDAQAQVSTAERRINLAEEIDHGHRILLQRNAQE